MNGAAHERRQDRMSNGMIRVFAVLLAAGALCAPASAALDCRRAPRKALPGRQTRAEMGKRWS